MTVHLQLVCSPEGVYEEWVPADDLPVGNERYPYILLVDPYGETMFSSDQCRVILTDFERLHADQPGPETKALLELIRRCSEDLKWCVWFMGD